MGVVINVVSHPQEEPLPTLDKAGDLGPESEQKPADSKIRVGLHLKCTITPTCTCMCMYMYMYTATFSWAYSIIMMLCGVTVCM